MSLTFDFYLINLIVTHYYGLHTVYIVSQNV